MPRLPPVIRATRWRSATKMPPTKSREQTRYRIPGALPSALTRTDLPESSYNDGHVVRLLGRAGPLLHGRQQSLGDTLGRGIAKTQDFAGKASRAEFLAVDVL